MKQELKKDIRMLSFDLDGTLTGNPDATLRFRETWESLEKENGLCYATIPEGF